MYFPYFISSQYVIPIHTSIYTYVNFSVYDENSMISVILVLSPLSKTYGDFSLEIWLNIILELIKLMTCIRRHMESHIKTSTLVLDNNVYRRLLLMTGAAQENFVNNTIYRYLFSSVASFRDIVTLAPFLLVTQLRVCIDIIHPNEQQHK